MATSTDHAASLDEDDRPDTSDALAAEQCAVAHCAELFCGKWTLLLVKALADGPRSFSELEARLAGISPRTLCDRLELLAREALLTRTRIKGLPPRTIYELTERGCASLPIIEAMRSVGEHLLRHPAEPVAAGEDAGPCCD